MRTSAPTLGTLAPGQTFARDRPLHRLKGASGVLKSPDRSQPDPLSSTETRSARSKDRLIGFIVAIARATGADSKLLSTLSTAQGRRASSDAPEKNRMSPWGLTATGLMRLGAVHFNSGKGLARKTPDASL